MNPAVAVNLVKNGLVMSYFLGKTVDMLVLVEDGPVIMENLHCLYCSECFGLKLWYQCQMICCPDVKDYLHPH